MFFNELIQLAKDGLNCCRNSNFIGFPDQNATFIDQNEIFTNQNKIYTDQNKTFTD